MTTIDLFNWRQSGQTAAGPIKDSPDLSSYRRILVAFSGGKDSLASVLHLLDSGVAPERIELHHHDIDGGAESFMDWPITPAYCQAIADHLGIPLVFSRKQGGFKREMERDNQATSPMQWQRPDGTWYTHYTTRDAKGTRRKFPQVSNDLSVRWCSAYLKIDVLASLIRNERRFTRGKTLVVTGERAQESTARAGYKTFEPHRTDNRHGARNPRIIDHWRPIHQWTEAAVWEIIQRHRIVPHPAYQLGWSRLSCRTCIFGCPDQWATIREVYPDAFAKIADQESLMGATLKRDRDIKTFALKGQAYQSAIKQPHLARFADQTIWDAPITDDNWVMPAGAFTKSAGPT